MNLRGKSRKLLGALTAAAMCITAIPTMPAFAANVGDVLRVQGGQTQHKGDCDGFSYEIWLDNTGGSGSMTLGKGATFKAEWSASVSRGNFLARRGLAFGSNKKATDYEYIGMDYEATYSQQGSGGNSRLCVYGWFENRNAAGNPPLVEYYIIEDWVNWRPTANGAAKTVVIDDGEYEIFAIDHTGPTIHGNSETFKQYFSVRKNTRTSGHITVSDHFKAWAAEGWGIGNLYEVALNAEGWESSGVADVTKLNVYLDPSQAGEDNPTNPTIPTDPGVEYTAPSGKGKGITDDFEGTGTDWTTRGEGVKYGFAKDFVHGGKQSLYVTGRTGAWHGLTASGSELKAGGSYSFDGFVGYESEQFASTGFTLGLTYTSGGQTNYDDIVDVTCSAGKWAELKSDFTVPAGASNIALYVQTAYTENPAAKDLISFYLDDVVLTEKGATPSTNLRKGDLNGDNVINAVDLTLCKNGLIKGFSDNAVKKAADVNGDGKVDITDMVQISKFILRLITEFETTGNTDPGTTDPGTEDPTPTVSDGKLMETARANFTMNVPGNVKMGDTGSTKKVTYFSKKAGANKSANVWVPAGYSTSKKYNVLYMNHGVFGNEDSMLESGFAVREMASNMIASGEAEPFIIVFPQMYTGPGGGQPGFGITMETMDNYDKFLADMTDSLMPYIEENYSVYTGKDHTAIAGFSMGGRETLYLTIMRPDLFGYACASSPAPGIVPASDSFLANHLGSDNGKGGRLTNADFKIDKDQMPYLLMIGGGTADGVVGTFPEEYHKLFTQNGTDHIWESFPGGGHDGSVGVPMFYNFFKYIFKK